MLFGDFFGWIMGGSKGLKAMGEVENCTEVVGNSNELCGCHLQPLPVLKCLTYRSHYHFKSKIRCLSKGL